ncbi:hypothetical protein CE91St41_02230 [Oscillospiraceae bacterium]|nr:hypothetical protein CE91St40_02230 [Oscillospiraceae bacterium]BDF73334.1 hypothetical protein CE91St41_02230 [Oscillospiraceae bacterium]
MMKARVVETNVGIQDEITVEMFDGFARDMRDKGWNGVSDMLACGLKPGELLEVGPGPGYVGLEVAKALGISTLTGCEISPAMIAVAEKNAAEYGIPARYVRGNAMEMPFPDGSFDCVVSNGSLHEWEQPRRVLDEIYRVLRPGGRYCITDLRRDVAAWKKWFICATTKPAALRPGYRSSLAAAYTPPEIAELLAGSRLSGAKVEAGFFSLCISGGKE